jgi:hypothetical protein
MYSMNKAATCGRQPCSLSVPRFSKFLNYSFSCIHATNSGVATRMDTQTLLKNIVQSRNPEELLSLYKDHYDVMITAHLVASMLKLPQLKVDTTFNPESEEGGPYEVRYQCTIYYLNSAMLLS